LINITPISLIGNWLEGFALGLHTISSEFSGYDEFGHEVFNTKRSEIGELLYRLKYKSESITAARGGGLNDCPGRCDGTVTV
jgi:hypothetical protein